MRIHSIAILAFLFAAVFISAIARSTPKPRLPVIDLHIHAYGWDHMGNPPPSNRITGKIPTARTDKAAMDATLTELKRFNVVKAVAAGPRERVLSWLAADPGRFIGGTIMGPDNPTGGGGRRHRIRPVPHREAKARHLLQQCSQVFPPR
jgi:hypothetical protein